MSGSKIYSRKLKIVKRILLKKNPSLFSKKVKNLHLRKIGCYRLTELC